MNPPFCHRCGRYTPRNHRCLSGERSGPFGTVHLVEVTNGKRSQQMPAHEIPYLKAGWRVAS